VNSHIIYHGLTKKLEQDMAHGVFYHEFGILCLLR